MKKVNWKVLIISLLIVYGIAFIGSIFTSTNTNLEWYQTIKPSLTPPNYVFPIVWNILFFLIAFSLYFAWANSKRKDRIKIAIVFGINFVLNVFWSVLFFAMKKPALAFAEIIFLWASILLMIFTTWKVDKKSSWLLVPYLVWVTFAGILNYLIAF